MNLQQPGHQAILRALAAQHVDCVVIGGAGLQLRGSRQPTRDVDITIAPGRANELRLEAALRALRARADGVGGVGTTFSTVHGRLDVMRGHERFADRASPVRVDEEHQISVAHGDDILRAKEQAGRPKDLAALPAHRRDLLASGHLRPDQLRGPTEASEPERETPAYLLAALGERPDDPQLRRLWEHTAVTIEDFRTRWTVTDPNRALGERPTTAGTQLRDFSAHSTRIDRTRDLLTRGPGRGREP